MKMKVLRRWGRKPTQLGVKSVLKNKETKKEQDKGDSHPEGTKKGG